MENQVLTGVSSVFEKGSEKDDTEKERADLFKKVGKLQMDLQPNIFIERFWRSLKYEEIYLEPSENGIELYGKVKWYMNFYNNHRLH